jgi:dGTPase
MPQVSLVADKDREKPQVAGSWSRLEREREQDVQLVPGATRARGAGARRQAEEPDRRRTCFERDRDRILHAAAFRRLAGKTQVFVFPSDHLRTRLTHALEVAQVATSIARACRLNVALAEAIALGHDCGHGPGGHASEEALSPYVAGGFDHAVWGADVTLADLNLCVETLDGVRNHSWRRPVAATLEGQVVSWADRIAYVCHDFEDSVHARVLGPDELPIDVRRSLGIERSGQLDTLVEGAIQHFEFTGVVGLPPDLAVVLDGFRSFNFERIYLRPASLAQAATVVRLLRALVDHLAMHPDTLAGVLPAEQVEADPLRAAVGYVAGMTDRFACHLARRELDYPLADLPRGIDIAG